MNKTAWEILSIANLSADTESNLTQCSVMDLSSTIQLGISIQNVYNESNTSAVRLYLYSSDNLSNWDTDYYAVFDNQFEANATKKVTIPISPDPYYLKATVKNQNLTDSATLVNVIATQGTI